MARPTKSTVDYFTHDAHASSGRTITILENHFGHEGYAIWFKLLECISVSNNHVIDLRNPIDVEYMSGKMRIKSDRLIEVLSLISRLGGIDTELWDKRIIWCQNFVDRLDGVYSRRGCIKPQRPDINNLQLLDYKVVNANNNPVIDNSKQVIDNGNTTKKRKVNKSRVEKSKEEDDPLPPTATPVENQSSSSVEQEVNIYDLYKKEIGEITPSIQAAIDTARIEYSTEWVTEAIIVASKAGGDKKSWLYIEAILKNCSKEGHSPINGNGHNKKKTKDNDPDRYIKGKYGHIVQR